MLNGIHMENEIIFKSSPKKAIMILLFSIALVAMSIWIVREKPIIGWIFAIFFGLGIPSALLMMNPNTTYLKLNQDGFEIVAMWRHSKFSWNDVEPFHIVKIRGNKMISFNFTPQFTKMRAGRAVASALTGMEGAIADHYKTPPEDLVKILNEWRERYSRPAI